MAQEYTAGYCNSCKADRKLERRGTNHVLHLLITIVLYFFTLPLFGIGALIWIVVWFLSSIKIGGWHCSVCGSTDVRVKNRFRIGIWQVVMIVLIFGIFLSFATPKITNVQKINTPKKSEVESQVDNKYSDEEIAQIREELASVVPNDVDVVSSAIWTGNRLTVRTKESSGLYGFAEYLCDNVLKSGRYDAVFGNVGIVHIVVRDKNGVSTIDKAECVAESQ